MNNIVPEFRKEEKFDRPYCTFLSPKPSPIHYHRHIEFLVVTKGELKLEIEGVTKILKVGDCAFIFPYVMHSYKVEGEPVRFCACIEPECLGGLGKIILEYRSKTPFIAGHALKRVLPDIQRMMEYLTVEHCRASDPVVYSQQLSYLSQIFSSLIALTGLVRASNKHSLYSDAVKLCCDNFTHEDFDTDILAERLNVSVSRIRQVFAENMDMSPKKYISLLRIDHAQTLLSNTSLAISIICEYCGYGSIRTFNREFSAVCGMSPSKFREDKEK